MNKVFSMVAAALMSLSMASHVGAEPYSHVTLLVMPARYSVLQVGFDMIQRQSAIMISYQGDASSEYPVLHAWDGSEWVYISLRDYAEANFAQIKPGRTILVGGENELPPALVEASNWAPNLLNVPSIDTATLVNSFGTVFKFRQTEWQWFAQRYNLDLNDLNEQRREGSWYDQSHIEIQDQLEHSAKDPMELLRKKWDHNKQSPSAYIDEPIPMSSDAVFDDVEDEVFDEPAELEIDDLEEDVSDDARVFDDDAEARMEEDAMEEVVIEETLPEPSIAEVVEEPEVEMAAETAEDVVAENPVWDEPEDVAMEEPEVPEADEDFDLEEQMEEAERELEAWETRRPSLEEAEIEAYEQPNHYSSDGVRMAQPKASEFVPPLDDSYAEPEGWEERAVATEPR